MMELGISSYLFGKITDNVLHKFFDNLNIKDRNDKKELENCLKEFKKNLLERHKEDPNFESVLNFWQTNNVPEEIFKIRYTLDSQYSSYEEYKQDLSSKYENELVQKFSNSIMDELNKLLEKKIQKLSSLSQADCATISRLSERKQSNKLRDQRTNRQSSNLTTPEALISRKSQIELDYQKPQILNLKIIGGFENGQQTEYKIANFEENRELISDAILSRDFKYLSLQNYQSYKSEYDKLKEHFDSLDLEDETYSKWENEVMKARRFIKNFDEHLENICKCIQLYFEEDNVFGSAVIQTPSDLKKVIEVMLNTSIEGTEYQFFISPWDGIYFNVYLTENDESYINQKDEKILTYARLGGDYVNIKSLNKIIQIKIIVAFLLMLVKGDKQNLSQQYYQIGNYLMALG